MLALPGGRSVQLSEEGAGEAEGEVNSGFANGRFGKRI
jgi:hypothetical protein